MSPASSMKLLTTLVALDELGPSFRWKTSFLSEQPVERGVLRGPLYLRGGGDPNLTWDKLALLLRSLRNQGIRKIAGDIVLDRTYFQPSRPDLGALPFDESPTAYYNVIPDALLIHSNLVSLALDANTDTIRVQLATPLADIKLINHLTFNELPCKEWDQAGLKPSIEINRRRSVELLLTGSFPKRCQATANLNVLDRNLYIESTLRALWAEMGGSWQGHTRDGETPANAMLLAERESETLAEIIRLTNKFSDNGMARGLYLSLGAEALAKQSTDLIQSGDTASRLHQGTVTSTAAASEIRIRQWLARHQIADQGIVIDNGSGLSRAERLSTAQLAQILQVALHDSWYPEFASSFPIAALDGTMRKRLKASAAEQRARIKTGTLKNALAIAGYVRDLNNIDWIVVAFINDEAAPQGKDALDNLMTWLASGELSDTGNINHHSSDIANKNRQ
jgi:D-alanyl-D-alanine carboxypeptidase/D-alanyl-D-alanine-endopeptidase (penicillin-binding protein 4)